MKIYFCDTCNESIPLQDLESGAAITVRGKVMCRNCRAAAAGEGPPSPRRSGLHPAFGWILGLPVLALAGGLAFALLGIRGSEEALADLRADLVGRVDGGFAAAARNRGDLSRRLDALEGRLREVSGTVEESRRLQEKEAVEGRTRFESVQAYIRENEETKDRLDRDEIRLTAVEESVRRLQAGIEGLRSEIQALPSVPAAVSPPSPPAAANAERSDSLPPRIGELLAKLKDPTAGVRWSAVTELGEAGDARAVPHLVLLLKDPDVFVRHNTALTLRDLDARESVPALVETLSDDQGIVRDSAITALRHLTGQTLKFDPYGRKDERDRAVRDWRKWWEQNGEKFLRP